MKYFLVSKGLDVVSRLLNWTPNFLWVLFARAMALLWFYVFPFKVDIVLKNLNQAFGQEKTPQAIRSLAIANLNHYVLFLIEFIQFRTLSIREFKSRFSQDHIAWIAKALEEKKQVIILTAHMGNFEWLAAWSPLVEMPLHMIVRPVKNKTAERLLNEQRSRTGVQLISDKNSKWAIFRLLRQQQVVAVMLDQKKAPPDGIFVDFFGRQAGTMRGLAALVERTEAVVFPAYIHRTALGRFQVNIQPPLDYKKVGTRKENIYTNTQAYSKNIEAVIRKHPEQWFWIHDRYKGSPDKTHLVPKSYETVQET